MTRDSGSARRSTVERLGVGGVTVVRLPRFSDPRGDLVPVELERDLPFLPKRMFVVRGVPEGGSRGEHAHRTLHQFLVCLVGACSLIVDDGSARREIRLDEPWVGVHLPPRVWGKQYRFSPDAVLLVLASHAYDPTDYIDDYDEFLREWRPERPDEA